jgi:hypothetical protein
MPHNGFTHEIAVRGASDDWLTPPEIISALGPFDLDPCAAPDQPWPTAARHYALPDNGLELPWTGFVWCNPPYGPLVGAWLRRMREHDNGIMLIFARVETRQFFTHVWGRASALFFPEGRIQFYSPDGTRIGMNAAAPSVLIGYGSEAARRLASVKLNGAFVLGAGIVKRYTQQESLLSLLGVGED